MKILLIRKRWSHHAAKSGYDRIFQDFEEKRFRSIFYKRYLIFGLVERLFKLILKKTINLDLIVIEIKVLIYSLVFKPEVIHFCFLQENLWLLKKIKPKAKLIMTVHLPPSYWKMNLQSEDNLYLMDQIIVLDDKSKVFFGEKFQGKVQLIPHAVDLKYFQPNASLKNKAEQFQCLFVGRFLRDINFLLDFLEFCNEKEENIHFHVCLPLNIQEPSFFRTLEILNNSNVTHYNYLTDNQLLTLYQSADVLIQPLHDCTANNVVLEAMACGLPIIVNNVGGIKSYLSPNNFELLVPKKTTTEFYDKILKLKKRKIDPTFGREHIQEYSLANVRKKLIDFYKKTSVSGKKENYS